MSERKLTGGSVSTISIISSIYTYKIFFQFEKNMSEQIVKKANQYNMFIYNFNQTSGNILGYDKFFNI